MVVLIGNTEVTLLASTHDLSTTLRKSIPFFKAIFGRVECLTSRHPQWCLDFWPCSSEDGTSFLQNSISLGIEFKFCSQEK